MQQGKLHVGGDLRHQPPILAQHIAGAADEGVMRGALLQRLQDLAQRRELSSGEEAVFQRTGTCSAALLSKLS